MLQIIAGSRTNKPVAGGLGISVKRDEKHPQPIIDMPSMHYTARLKLHAISSAIIENIVRMEIV